MRIEPLGDAAFILRDLETPAYMLAEHLNRMPVPGLIEAWASYETVGISVEPSVFRRDSLVISSNFEGEREPKFHEIPACFDLGEDLEEVARELGISLSRFIEKFCQVEFRCYAIGFCPGFPYMGYLPTELCGVVRLASPRLKVPAGSIAITGNQAGIYPISHSGGWKIIARTPLTIVDVAADYFPISAGHRVRFGPIHRDEFEARRGERL